MEKSVSVTVVICTYKRPRQLRLLLDSLNCQVAPNLIVKVRVVDNDVMMTAKAVIDSVEDSYSWPINYISQPIKNISLTRNAGIEQLDTDFMAFVDDDEVVCTDWIASLIRTAHAYNANVVFGPVLSIYPDNTSAWVKYDRPRHLTGNSVPLGEARTGNVLIDVSYLYSNKFEFDTSLGLSGGEDSAFFGEMYKVGCKAVWSDESVASEDVPISRAQPKWFLVRSFRIGSVEASLALRRAGLYSVIKVISKSLYLTIVSAVLLFALPVRGVGPSFMSLRNLAVAIGMIYGLLKGPYNEYK